MVVPDWIYAARTECIIRVVRSDARTSGDRLLGVDGERVFQDVIRGGMADFEADWVDPRDSSVRLSGRDRALLYGWFNMKGHLEELSDAFDQIFADGELPKNPIVVDLGCGPGTAALSLAGALGCDVPFDYVGVDRAQPMLDLAKDLELTARANGQMKAARTQWVRSLHECDHQAALGWRPVLVVCSYLLASPSLDPAGLVRDVVSWLSAVTRAEVLVLYTNSAREDRNKNYEAFKSAWLANNFIETIPRQAGVVQHSRTRRLCYAVFTRPAQNVLEL